MNFWTKSGLQGTARWTQGAVHLPLSVFRGHLAAFKTLVSCAFRRTVSLVGVWEWVRGEPRLNYLCVHLPSCLPAPAVPWEASSFEMGLGNQRPRWEGCEEDKGRPACRAAVVKTSSGISGGCRWV